MKGTPRRATRPDKGRPTASGTTSTPDPRRPRADHSQELAQDYVKAIADLIATSGEARVTDLARRLAVTHVTINRTLKRLQREGWVTTLPYRSIFLTEAGRQLADDAGQRHRIVVAFLKTLGVPDTVAESDADGIEHHVSPETVAAFRKHLERLGG